MAGRHRPSTGISPFRRQKNGTLRLRFSMPVTFINQTYPLKRECPLIFGFFLYAPGGAHFAKQPMIARKLERYSVSVNDEN
jgi:hypothetical protein